MEKPCGDSFLSVTATVAAPPGPKSSTPRLAASASRGSSMGPSINLNDLTAKVTETTVGIP